MQTQLKILNIKLRPLLREQ